MPISFGSVGDIIAVAQIAGKLYKALSASQGSAREFRELVVELSVFHAALEEVLVLWPTRPNLETSLDLVTPIVNECKEVIETFLKRIVVKYGRRLGGGALGKKGFREMGRMLQWHIFETEAVAKLRERLGRANALVRLVVMQAQSAAIEYDGKVIARRLEELSALEGLAKRDLNRRINEVQESLNEQTMILEDQNVVLETISSGVQNVVATVGPMAEATYDMRNMLVKLQDTFLDPGRVPRNLSPWLQNSLYLEDSLGYVLPVPLEVISSWETLHSVLCDKFKDRPGLELVKQRRYVFQDSTNARDLSAKVKFTLSVRPGQKVNMAMILFSADGGSNTCPRCGTRTSAGHDMDVECPNAACKMIYRRVTDVTESTPFDEGDGASKQQSISTRQEVKKWDDASDVMPDWLSDKEGTDYSPEIFKRVRLFTRWQDAEESRSSYSYTLAGGIKMWEPHGAATSQTIAMYEQLVDTFARAHPRLDGSPDFTVGWILSFVGTTRLNSRPILFIHGKYRETRDVVCADLKEIEWLSPEKSGIMTVVSCIPSIRSRIVDWLPPHYGGDEGFWDRHL